MFVPVDSRPETNQISPNEKIIMQFRIKVVGQDNDGALNIIQIPKLDNQIQDLIQMASEHLATTPDQKS
jgi:hypothetical protein